MRILAVETSAEAASAAVMEDGILKAEYILNDHLRHSVKMMPVIDQLFKTLNIDVHDIDVFAVSCGPGSFTGLRIGITTVKAMAYAAGKMTCAVPTLDILAYGAGAAEGMLVCPLMDARNNQVYASLFRMDNEMPQRLTDYVGKDIDLVIKMTEKYNEPVLFSGDAAYMHLERIKKTLGERAFFAPEIRCIAKAGNAALLALFMIKQNRLIKPDELSPFYLRESQAERLYKAKKA